MNYITKNLDSFTKRIAEAINGRQIEAKASKPSKPLKLSGIGKVRFILIQRLKLENLQA